MVEDELRDLGGLSRPSLPHHYQHLVGGVHGQKLFLDRHDRERRMGDAGASSDPLCALLASWCSWRERLSMDILGSLGSGGWRGGVCQVPPSQLTGVCVSTGWAYTWKINKYNEKYCKGKSLPMTFGRQETASLIAPVTLVVLFHNQPQKCATLIITIVIQGTCSKPLGLAGLPPRDSLKHYNSLGVAFIGKKGFIVERISSIEYIMK